MIHILTLNWNGLNKLQTLEPSLENVLRPISGKFIWHIRDNGSKDQSVEWLKGSHKLDVQPMFVDHNKDNFAQGMNSLIDRANIKDEDFVVFLNNDVVFQDSQSLTNMLLHFVDDKVGMVGARLMYNRSDKLQHAGVIFGRRYGMMPYHFKHKQPLDNDSRKDRYFQAVTAACCVVRGKALHQAGWFDENYFWSFEDIDLCLTLGQHNWKIVYCGNTEIYHEESASLKKNPVNQMMMKPNVAHFKSKWWKQGQPKYDLDHDKYLKAPNWNVIRNR